MRAMRVVCDCGGEVPRPLPPKCPHCGRVITKVHQPIAAWLSPLLIVTGLFALLVLGVLAIVRWFGG